jgi:hypothetical protein
MGVLACPPSRGTGFSLCAGRPQPAAPKTNPQPDPEERTLPGGADGSSAFIAGGPAARAPRGGRAPRGVGLLPCVASPSRAAQSHRPARAKKVGWPSSAVRPARSRPRVARPHASRRHTPRRSAVRRPAASLLPVPRPALPPVPRPLPYGPTVTITRRYRDNGGVPLSVTRTMKWIVSVFSTFGAVTNTRAVSSAPVSTRPG